MGRDGEEVKVGSPAKGGNGIKLLGCNVLMQAGGPSLWAADRRWRGVKQGRGGARRGPGLMRRRG